MVSHYGDTVNVKADAKKVFDILDRQGGRFLIDCFADYSAEKIQKYKIDSDGTKNLVRSLVSDLKEALLERVYFEGDLYE